MKRKGDPLKSVFGVLPSKGDWLASVTLKHCLLLHSNLPMADPTLCSCCPYQVPILSLLLLLFTLLQLLLSAFSNALQNTFPVFIHLQFRDDAFARVDTNGYRLAVGLFTGDTLDVNDVFEAVDRGDFAFSTFVGASDDGYLSE